MACQPPALTKTVSEQEAARWGIPSASARRMIDAGALQPQPEERSPCEQQAVLLIDGGATAGGGINESSPQTIDCPPPASPSTPRSPRASSRSRGLFCSLFACGVAESLRPQDLGMPPPPPPPPQLQSTGSSQAVPPTSPPEEDEAPDEGEKALQRARKQREQLETDLNAIPRVAYEVEFDSLWTGHHKRYLADASQILADRLCESMSHNGVRISSHRALTWVSHAIHWAHFREFHPIAPHLFSAAVLEVLCAAASLNAEFAPDEEQGVFGTQHLVDSIIADACKTQLNKVRNRPSSAGWMLTSEHCLARCQAVDIRMESSPIDGALAILKMPTSYDTSRGRARSRSADRTNNADELRQRLKIVTELCEQV